MGIKTLNDKNVDCPIFSNFRISNNKITKLTVFEVFIFDRSLNPIII